MRFVVQWIASERARKSVIPVAFWFFSIGGGALLLVYALYRRDRYSSRARRSGSWSTSAILLHHRQRPAVIRQRLRFVRASRICRGCGQRGQIVFSVLVGGQFARGVEHGIGHRTDMRVNSPQVAQHVE